MSQETSVDENRGQALAQQQQNFRGMQRLLDRLLEIDSQATANRKKANIAALHETLYTGHPNMTKWNSAGTMQGAKVVELLLVIPD